MDSHPSHPARALMRIYVAVVVLVAAFSFVVGTARADTLGSPDYLVTFAPGTSESDQAAAIAAAGGTDVSEVAPLRMHTVSLPDQSALDALKANSSVASIDVDKTRDITAIPSDPGYPSQWSLSKIGWDQVYGSVNPVGTSTVAILDTGVNAMHEDLAGKVVPGTSVLDP